MYHIPIIAILVCLLFPLSGTFAQESTSATKSCIDVVFALDTTSSMSGMIAGAKDKIWAIVNTLASAKPTPRIRIGIVAYRDRGDAYITKNTILTDDLDAAYSQLMKLQAEGGGDGPESVNQALNEAVTIMSWSEDKNTYKVLFLVGDCPPHMDYPDDVKYPETCKKAVTSGIIINTLLCGQNEDAAKVWRTIAHLSEGTFDSVDQSGGAITISTPMDATLAALSVRLDATRLNYGDAKVQKAVEKRKLDSAALVDSLSPSSVAERAAFNAKDAGMVNFAGPQELVSDWQDKKVKIEELPKEQLPPAIRDLAPDIQKETLERLSVERTKVQKEILVLDRQRQEYIQQALAKQHVGQDSFDMRMRQAMTTQAKAKNIDISSPVLNEPSKIK